MAKAPKMVNLAIEETSGVDHPAHLHEGWLVVKAADQAEADQIVEALVAETEGTEEEPVPDQTVTEDAPVVSEEPTVETLTDALAKAEEKIADLEARLTDLAPAPVQEPSDDDLLKSAPEAVVKMVETLRAEREEAVAKAAEAEEILRKEREAALDAEAIEKARSWENLSIDPTVIGPALRHLADHDADLAKSVEDALSAANAQAESGAIFAEIGKAAPVVEGDAYARLTSLAKSLVTEGRAATFEQAFADVATSNPELYAQYTSEKGA